MRRKETPTQTGLRGSLAYSDIAVHAQWCLLKLDDMKWVALKNDCLGLGGFIVHWAMIKWPVGNWNVGYILGGNKLNRRKRDKISVKSFLLLLFE